MKKILSLAAVGLALCSLLVSCASTGAKKADGAAAPSIPHPRSYVVDVADSCESIDLAYNQYGPNYQAALPNLWKLLKADKPLAGDKVTVNMKITSDTDIPAITWYLIDNSPAASYWTVISGDYAVKDVKAGEPVTVVQEVELTESTKGGFQIILSYDGKDHGQDAYEKVGKASKVTFERITNTTDTVAEIASATGVDPNAPKGPQTYNVELEKLAAFCEIQTNHPWVNGTQDMSQISNYQATPCINDAIPDMSEPLKAGTKLHVTWHAVSDKDIANLYMRPVDNSQEANWWKELQDNRSDEDCLFASDIKAGVPFNITKDLTLDQDMDGTTLILCIWYNYDAETNGPGPCTIILSRD